MLIDALHSALEDRAIALDRIRVDHAITLASNVFVDLVLDPAVAGELLADAFVPSRCIGQRSALRPRLAIVIAAALVLSRPTR
jgi:hypothetical protein